MEQTSGRGRVQVDQEYLQSEMNKCKSCLRQCLGREGLFLLRKAGEEKLATHPALRQRSARDGQYPVRKHDVELVGALQSALVEQQAPLVVWPRVRHAY